MVLTDPVIIVPGITATYLEDRYPIAPEIVWSVMTRDYNRAILHPSDLRYELKEPARVVPGQVFELVYKQLVHELRYELSPSAEQEVPVFAFGYDWRKPLELVQAELSNFVDEVVDRTKLIPHYYNSGYGLSRPGTVTLIGHSMGGLVIAGYLATHNDPEDHKVSRVVTLASPFRGSLEAVVKVATGLADLGTGVPKASEREASRMTPALYHLLPSFKNSVIADDGLSSNLYEAKAWQRSVLSTIRGFIEKHGLPPGNPDINAEDFMNSMLDTAQAHRKKLERFKLSQAGLGSKDWLCIAGTGCNTRVGLAIRKEPDGTPRFEVNSLQLQNTGRKTGDGTVPVDGAMNAFIPEENIVCVTPEDFGHWELQNKLLAQTQGFHGFVPAMNMLHRLIVRYLLNKPDRDGNTWGRPVPGVANEDWNPPIDGLKNVMAV